MTIDSREIQKFSYDQATWWDPDGPFKTLHDINPIRLKFIMQWTPLNQQRVLDIGCGGGILTEAIAKCGADVTGLDASSAAITAATLHAQQYHLSIQYVCQSLETFTEPPFDVICCMELLEHVADPILLLQEAARLLKPGGHLFLSTINRTPLAYLTTILAAEYVLRLLPKQTHDYLKFIKPSELATMVRKSGLTVINLSGLRYHPFTRSANLHDSVNINYLMACQKGCIALRQ